MRKILMAVFAVGVIAGAGTALAATNNLTVQASVVGTCKFNSASSTLDFGSLDPAAGGNVNGSATTQFWCTKGTADVISAGNGQNYDGVSRNMKSGVSSDLIPYSLSLTKDSILNAGPGTLRTLTISGQVIGTDYTGKTAGSYSDIVLLTITPSPYHPGMLFRVDGICAGRPYGRPPRLWPLTR